MIDFLHNLKVMQGKFTPNNDKLGHFFWGFIYCIIGSLIDYFINSNFMFVLFPLLVAVLAEYLDKKTGKGNAEFLDVVFTISPSIMIFLINNINGL